MIEYMKYTSDVELAKPGVLNLYQLQIEGLKTGWLIYPMTLNPLTLTIKRKKTKAAISTRLDIMP